ncbi:Sulfotransferase domain protein [Posidoniimonas corsicana]|uniref:Sulfotransferase domain protein n=1 Tax=Posidoniimonas corsicana TaxID=1938618 RepID=A0A5C5V653_9BACT|nr:Sulfotransferase domain protein [Posidoniimonas corsicana]
MDSPPIVILGAARSGTRFLRSVIAASRAVGATPYDMNFVWRHGSESCPHDALPAAWVTERSASFIRNRLRDAAGLRTDDARSLVEKTVSNTLRAPYVQRVLPAARFIHLIRDGRDVVESSMRCWRDPPRASYLLKKLRAYPLGSCLPYALKHGLRTARRAAGFSDAVSSWGPRYPGIDQDYANHPLALVCARQWQCCLDSFDEARGRISPDKLLEIRYEDLVTHPSQTALKLAEWLQLPDAHTVVSYATTHANDSSIGGRRRLSSDDQATVSRALGSTLERLGYGTCDSDIAA